MVRSCRSFLVSLLCAASLAAADSSSTSYTIQTVAGNDSSGDGGKALSAALSQPEGMAIDGAGNVYVADAAENRVRKILTDGTIQTVAGTGVGGFAGDGGPANSALLNQPYGLALDPTGNLYIADLGNARVRRVAVDGTIQTVAGGGTLAANGTGQGGPATSAQLTQPRNLAIGPGGSLYISDFGANQVYRVSSNSVLSIVAGTGTAGSIGVGTSALLAELSSPAGLVADSTGALYIADSGNNCVRKVYDGVIITVFNTPAPTGVALDSTGTLYVAASSYFGTVSQQISSITSARDVQVDASGNVYASSGAFVMEIPDNGVAATIAGSGASPYFGGDSGPATSAQLYSPSGIAVDSSGNWYIADTGNNRIRMVTAAGVISTIAGTGVAGATGDNGPALKSQLSGPESIAIDGSNNLYIADTGNNEVRKITTSGIISTIAGQLKNPVSVAVDAQGSVYIADSGNNRIAEVTASGTISSLATITGPRAVAVDASGDVVAADATQVWSVTQGKTTSLIGGLTSPSGLAYASDGTLLIADTGANVVRAFSTDGSLAIIAGTGAAGFGGDGSPALAAELNAPAGIAISANSILIADSGNNRIRSLTPSAVPATPPSVTVVNAASLAKGLLVPDEIITIFGSGFDPANTQLLFDGQPATVFYLSATQINALAPATLTPSSTSKLSIVVDGSTLAESSVAVVGSAPGIFTVAGGTGQAAANNQDGTLNSASNPAARGSIISLYATGEGSDSGTVTLNIAGYNAPVLYAGPAPGFEGLMQINAQIPNGFLPPGIQTVVLSVGGAVSQVGVTIALQ